MKNEQKEKHSKAIAFVISNLQVQDCFDLDFVTKFYRIFLKRCTHIIRNFTKVYRVATWFFIVMFD